MTHSSDRLLMRPNISTCRATKVLSLAQLLRPRLGSVATLLLILTVLGRSPQPTDAYDQFKLHETNLSSSETMTGAVRVGELVIYKYAYVEAPFLRIRSSANSTDAAPLFINIREHRKQISWKLPSSEIRYADDVARLSKTICANEHNLVMELSTYSPIPIQFQFQFHEVYRDILHMGHVRNAVILPQEPLYAHFVFPRDTSRVWLKVYSKESSCIRVTVKSFTCPHTQYLMNTAPPPPHPTNGPNPPNHRITYTKIKTVGGVPGGQGGGEDRTLSGANGTAARGRDNATTPTGAGDGPESTNEPPIYSTLFEQLSTLELTMTTQGSISIPKSRGFSEFDVVLELADLSDPCWEQHRRLVGHAASYDESLTVETRAVTTEGPTEDQGPAGSPRPSMPSITSPSIMTKHVRFHIEHHEHETYYALAYFAAIILCLGTSVTFCCTARCSRRLLHYPEVLHSPAKRRRNFRPFMFPRCSTDDQLDGGGANSDTGDDACEGGSDLPRGRAGKSKLKSGAFLWNLLVVAAFYTLPAVQLLFSFFRTTRNQPSQDTCYYNHMCANPLGPFVAFNNLYSNLGYVGFGAFFSLIVWLHKDRFPRRYVEVFYAMGVALSFEGVLSAGYHICPTEQTFQFDTTFMYVITGLCIYHLYQIRNPPHVGHASKIYGIFAMAAAFVVVGIVSQDIRPARIAVAVLFVLIAGIVVFCVIRALYVKNLAARTIPTPVPIVFGVIQTLLNLTFIAYSAWTLLKSPDHFPSALLNMFIVNLFIFTIFYYAVKISVGERILAGPALATFLATASWSASLYFYNVRVSNWQLTAAGSRALNRPCVFLDFFDDHDVWHLGSAFSLFLSFLLLFTFDDGQTIAEDVGVVNSATAAAIAAVRSGVAAGGSVIGTSITLEDLLGAASGVRKDTADALRSPTSDAAAASNADGLSSPDSVGGSETPLNWMRRLTAPLLTFDPTRGRSSEGTTSPAVTSPTAMSPSKSDVCDIVPASDQQQSLDEPRVIEFV